MDILKDLLDSLSFEGTHSSLSPSLIHPDEKRTTQGQTLENKFELYEDLVITLCRIKFPFCKDKCHLWPTQYAHKKGLIYILKYYSCHRIYQKGPRRNFITSITAVWSPDPQQKRAHRWANNIKKSCFDIRKNLKQEVSYIQLVS